VQQKKVLTVSRTSVPECGVVSAKRTQSTSHATCGILTARIAAKRRDEARTVQEERYHPKKEPVKSGS